MTDGAVEAIVARIGERVDDVARAMAERYRAEIVDYSTLDEELLFNDVAVISRDNLKTLLANLESGEVIGPEELEEFKDGAARRVHQGIPLESLLHAYRLWGQIVWETILSTADAAVPEEREAALKMAGRVLEHIDLVSTAAAQAYLDEAEDVWSDREVLRRDLLEALISGRIQLDRVQAQASALRLDLQDSYVVVLVRPTEDAADELRERPLSARAALRRVVDLTKAHLRPHSAGLLVGLRHGEVIALYPASGPGEVDVLKQQAQGLAGSVALHGFAVGIGGLHPGQMGIGTSYAEAREALDLADGLPGRPVAFDQVLLENVLLSTPKKDRLLRDAVLPLRAYDERHGTDLVVTLRAYMESGFNLTQSARNLMVHPNTVVYRLRRIKELTGRDPHEPNDLLLLCLGLKLLAAGYEPEPRS